MQQAHENATLIHLPIDASWLNQIELYFSIVQRKLTPSDFGWLDELAERLLAFGENYRQTRPTVRVDLHRDDLNRALDKTADREPHPRLAA